MSATEFVDAAACGDLNGVKSLLEDETLSRDIINCVDKDGRSAFHYACLNDDVPLLTILMADDRVDVCLTSPKGDTGLHMASLYAALEAMAMLHADGRVALGAKNNYGETPLHLCAGSGDKGAGKAAALLLQWGAPLDVVDKWGRGPVDVSRDNGENPLLAVFTAHLAKPENAAHRTAVDDVTAAYAAATEAHTREVAQAAAQKSRVAAANIFGALGGVKLKKTATVERTMFRPSEGQGSGTGGDADAGAGAGDKRKALSKLIDFPGDVAEVTRHLENSAEVDPAGSDAYGLTALHKFASWNKTMLMELLLPHLTPEQLEARCPDGKTALHWAVEMAAVASVKLLLESGADRAAADGKGRTVAYILDNSGDSGVVERLKAAIQTERKET